MSSSILMKNTIVITVPDHLILLHSILNLFNLPARDVRKIVSPWIMEY
jgi:hypothetical protein